MGRKRRGRRDPDERERPQPESRQPDEESSEREAELAKIRSAAEAWDALKAERAEQEQSRSLFHRRKG